MKIIISCSPNVIQCELLLSHTFVISCTCEDTKTHKQSQKVLLSQELQAVQKFINSQQLGLVNHKLMMF